MLRKKLTLILGILAALALMVSACAPQTDDAEINPPAVEEDMADEELMVEDETEDAQDDNGNDEMEVNDDSANSGDSGTDGNADDLGDAQPSQITDEEMEALIKEKAGDQHTLDFILGQNKTYDEWVVTLDRMIGYGADINEEEKELIIQWLINR